MAAKRKKGRKRGPLPPSKTLARTPLTESDPEPLPDEVTGTEIAPRRGRRIVLPGDTTTAALAAEEEAVTSDVSTWPAFIERYIARPFSRGTLTFRVILPLAFILLLVVIFWQDNAQGKVDDWPGILWAFVKVGIFTFAAGVGALLLQKLLPRGGA